MHPFVAHLPFFLHTERFLHVRAIQPLFRRAEIVTQRRVARLSNVVPLIGLPSFEAASSKSVSGIVMQLSTAFKHTARLRALSSSPLAHAAIFFLQSV